MTTEETTVFQTSVPFKSNFNLNSHQNPFKITLQSEENQIKEFEIEEDKNFEIEEEQETVFKKNEPNILDMSVNFTVKLFKNLKFFRKIKFYLKFNFKFLAILRCF